MKEGASLEALADASSPGAGIEGVVEDRKVVVGSQARVWCWSSIASTAWPRGMPVAGRARGIARQSLVAGMGLSLTAMGFAALGFIPPVAGASSRRASTSRSS